MGRLEHDLNSIVPDSGDAIGLLDQGPLPLSGDGEYVEGAM